MVESMNVKTPQSSTFLLLAIVLGMVLLFVPFPNNQSLTGLVTPYSSYSILSDGNGAYSTSLTEAWTDQVLTAQHMVPDRGGLLEFQAPFRGLSQSRVEVGDTLAWLRSSEIETDIASLEGNLATLKATLRFERSGSRATEIEGAQLQLTFAKARHEEQKKILARSADLLSRNIISQQDYEQDLRRERLDAIRISIAEADLGSALTGAQSSKLEVIYTQIAEVERKLELSRKVQAAMVLTSPLRGQILFPLDTDSLISVVRVDTMVVQIPVSMEDINDADWRRDLQVRGHGISVDIPADEIQLKQQIYSIGSTQIVVLRVRLDNAEGALQIGQRLEVSFGQRSQSLFQLFMARL